MSADGVDPWDEASFVLSSDYRTDVLCLLVEDGPSMPSTLAERTGISIAHVSRALREMQQRELVELLVPEGRRKGRVYGVTERGELAQDKVAETASGSA